MSKLKTLKDLPSASGSFGDRYGITDSYNEYPDGCGELIKKKDLRQEVIKWIKEYGVISLDKFLNITEEDLK